jgi:hypothetical protein
MIMFCLADRLSAKFVPMPTLPATAFIVIDSRRANARLVGLPDKSTSSVVSTRLAGVAGEDAEEGKETGPIIPAQAAGEFWQCEWGSLTAGKRIRASIFVWK